MEQGGEPLRTFSAAELEILNALPVVMYLADWKEGQKRIAWANKAGLGFLGRSNLDELKTIQCATATEGARRNQDWFYDAVQVRQGTVGPMRQTIHPPTGSITFDCTLVPMSVTLPGEETPTVLALHTNMIVTMDGAAAKAECGNYMFDRFSTMALLFAQEDWSLIHQNSLARLHFEKMAGREPNTVSLRDVLGSYKWEDLQMESALAKVTALQVGQGVVSFEREVIERESDETEDGKRVRKWHKIQFEAALDPTPGVSRVAILVTASDVSDLRKAQSDLLLMHTEQEQFFAEVAHELRTPLHAVTGLSEAMYRDPRCPEDMRSKVDIIHSQSKRLSAMVSDIVDSASNMRKTLLIKHESIDLRQLVVSACDTMRTMARATVDVSHVLPPTLPKVQGDSQRLFQVLVNLIANSLRFTSRGSVMVSAAYDKANDTVSLSVADTGIGIPPDKLETVFDPYKQVDHSTTRKYGGTGLGLSLVKALVDAHQGDVKMASQHGGPSTGTTVTVTLPCRQNALDSSPLWSVRGDGDRRGSGCSTEGIEWGEEGRRGRRRDSSVSSEENGDRRQSVLEEEEEESYQTSALDTHLAVLNDLMFPCWLVDASHALQRDGECRIAWANGVASQLWGKTPAAMKGFDAFGGPLGGEKALTRAGYARLREGDTLVVQQECNFAGERRGRMHVIVRRLGSHPDLGAQWVLHVGLRSATFL